jgi:hypothetical protein
MANFSEAQFRRKVDNALKTVRATLDNTRRPKYAADIHHAYDDKYALAE